MGDSCNLVVGHNVEIATNKADIEELKGHVGPMVSKMNNGLSDLPREVRGIRNQVWGLVVGAVLLVLGTGFVLGRTLGHLETLLQTHIEWTESSREVPR